MDAEKRQSSTITPINYRDSESPAPSASSFSKLLSHKILSREAEADLARRASSGDVEAHRQLILHNLRLVAKIAAKRTGRGKNFHDAFQAGVLGLTEAVDNFDPSRGRLANYATFFIKGSISEQHRASLPIPPAQKLYKEIGRDLRQKDNIPDQKTNNEGKKKREPINIFSLDSLVDVPREEVEEEISREKKSPYELMADRELRPFVMRMLRDVCQGKNKEREKEIIIKRYGLDGKETLTHRQLADMRGVSFQAIQQSEQRTLRKLREVLQKDKDSLLEE